MIGADRPGIVAAVTGVLADLGANLEDSSSTILRGHFTMTLVVASPQPAAAVEAALAGPAAALGLVIAVREVQQESEPGRMGSAHVLSVHGADRPRIVAAVTSLLAAAGGNVTDLSTRLSGGLYVLVAEVDLPAGADIAGLAADLDRLAAGLSVRASLRPADADLL